MLSLTLIIPVPLCASFSCQAAGHLTIANLSLIVNYLLTNNFINEQHTHTHEHTHTRPHVMTVQLSLVAFQLRWQHAILSKLNNKPNPSSLALREERAVSGRHTTPVISVCYIEWIDFNLLFN